ncbi:MAG: aminoglycoside phosphotransferase family protein [Clostridia bacterium]|nr:aminoglycoside phosphotransferase family protein [Clostridia bacterium]
MKNEELTSGSRTLEEAITEVCSIFGVPGKLVKYEPVYMGNINATYKVTYQHDDGSLKSYIVQKVNMYVFKKPKQIMSNIDLVTTYIKQKNAEAGINDTRSFMHFYHTHTGKRQNFYVDNDHAFWRISKYIENSMTFEVCDSLFAIEEAGRAFGKFQSTLCDFDASQLYETIPNFHNTKKRMTDFMKHVVEDSCDRVDSVTPEIEYLVSVSEKASMLTEMLECGELPLRVTHNDTKINNVLFDKDTERALVVIDLDTVMPGLVAHDFGDAVRFAANTAAEDEKDTSKIAFDLKKYEAFTRGFLPEVREALTKNEVDTLMLGAFTMTVELATRFLDDYITGDNYFKTRYPGHNLVRARSQIALARDIQRKSGKMNQIVKEVYEGK